MNDKTVLNAMTDAIVSTFITAAQWALVLAIFVAGSILLGPLVSNYINQAILDFGREMTEEEILISLSIFSAFSFVFCLLCVIGYFIPPDDFSRWFTPCIYVGALLWVGFPMLVGYSAFGFIGGIVLALTLPSAFYGWVTMQRESSRFGYPSL